MYCVQIDRAGENSSDDFASFAKENGIILGITLPYTHKYNDVAEKLIQDLCCIAQNYCSRQSYHMRYEEKQYPMQTI